MTNISNADELRATYLYVFDSFAASASDVADEVDGVSNVRFARELLGVLQSANLIAEYENENGVGFQTYPDTYDSIDRSEAESRIDKFLNTTPAQKEKNVSKTEKSKSKPEKAPETFHACYCGCKENVPSKSFYRPGHDARHAGVVGRKIAANVGVEGFDRRDLLNDLPSDALVAKAEAIAEKAIAKIEAKLAKEAARAEAKAAKEAAKSAPTVEDGIVKVGKNEFVATRDLKTGEVTYFDGKGATKAASKSAAKTFTVA